MSCRQNPKTFWVLNWFGSHQPTAMMVTPLTFHKYEVTFDCARCNCTLESAWMTQSDLLHMGLDLEKVRRMGRFGDAVFNLRVEVK